MADMSDWDGKERRELPHRYEVLEVLRDEMDARDARLISRLDKIADNQFEMKSKIQSWETGAAIVRWLAISTVAAVSGGMALYEKFRTHWQP
jgi:hypothetical protein